MGSESAMMDMERILSFAFSLPPLAKAKDGVVTTKTHTCVCVCMSGRPVVIRRVEKEVARNWVTSEAPLDIPLPSSGDDVPRFSAGYEDLRRKYPLTWNHNDQSRHEQLHYITEKEGQLVFLLREIWQKREEKLTSEKETGNHVTPTY
ncbi:unnamed protein product [Darwinula stevensoni]|uniref:Uncharacterized protein n=1 Tax=Darwinula stevensoni TaxID=69355 RepID=A0A7R9A6D1_9CRUS|nr:unnamed protein product [Darwinula stevensoni]CAG0894148.1 unnamed protein product [Darwinula stevensoni]